MVVPSTVNNGGDAGDGLLEVVRLPEVKWIFLVARHCRITQLMTPFLMIKMALLLMPLRMKLGDYFYINRGIV